ncbi:MAG: hypothetical protein WC372_09745 [Candidatus Neomarinimicrobiota bacterium]
MSEIPEVFAIFEQKLAHVLSFNLRQKGQKKAIEELLVYFSGIVGRASKAEARIAELSQAVGLITTLKPTMVMDVDHPLDMAKEVEAYVTARIAELEKENLELRKTLGWAYDLDEYKDNPEVQKCTTNSIKLNRSNEMETKNRNQLSEIRSGSTAPMGAIEVGEVTTAMSGLVSVVSKLQDSIAKLEVILQPVLPQDYFECDVSRAVAGSSGYSCPLAFSIENEIRRLSDLEHRLYILLINTKL